MASENRTTGKELYDIIDTINEVFILYDSELCVLWANNSASLLSGIPRDKIAGSTRAEIWNKAKEDIEKLF